MDETLWEQIRLLAEENNLDPDELVKLLGSGEMPEDLMAAISSVMGDISLFSEAANKLND